MSKNLLMALRKYKPTSKMDPYENYLTEAFAWLLNSDNNFRQYFLDYVCEKVDICKCKPKNISNEFSTQCNFEGIFPDMVYSYECDKVKYALIFEHKTWSNLHENQLQNYADFARSKYDVFKTILITASENQRTQPANFSCLWRDIYNLIDRWLKSEQKEVNFIFKDFLGLLAATGLGPIKPIEFEILKKINCPKKLKSKAKKTFQPALQLIAQISEKCDFIKISDGFGRIGFYIESSAKPTTWNPGFFIGIMYNPTDHKTSLVNSEKGPDFCLIIDINKRYHAKYPELEGYKSFLQELKLDVKKLNDGWNVLSHLAESKTPNKSKAKNKWHPIHIRKSLSDIIGNSTEIEDQLEKLNIASVTLKKLAVENSRLSDFQQSLRKLDI